ncbi:hypothetical protein BEN30_11625 [Magnetovibrio blakemorei]|uniref:Pyrrolo-quinoline quinone repeat domain-containing protein n=2 Tax=Magnetovibrio blakemorei TaxID=28181 RepID=A0A1E5Q6T1_9PROT|nr:hypothetical protein BEN30_11625 [Magnetovibrio blakemorei]
MTAHNKGADNHVGPFIFFRRSASIISATALFGLWCFFMGSFAQASSLTLTAKWQTDNTTLTPMSYDDGIVYASGDNTLEAWRLQDGVRLWQAILPSPAHFRPRLSETLVISAGRSHLNAWDRTTGSLIWSYKKSAQVAVPYILQDALFFGDGQDFIALNLTDGSERWRFHIEGGAEIHYGAIGRNDTVYLGAGDGVVYAFDAQTGAIKWSFANGADWQYLRQIYLDGDLIIAGGYHDEVLAIQTGNSVPDDKRISWRFYAGNFINSQLVANGNVYFWSPTGWIYAMNNRNGKHLWRHNTHQFKGNSKDWGSIMAELQAKDDHILALDMKRTLHVLSQKTGQDTFSTGLTFVPRPFVLPIPNSNHLLFGDLNGGVLVHELLLDKASPQPSQ